MGRSPENYIVESRMDILINFREHEKPTKFPMLHLVVPSETVNDFLLNHKSKISTTQASNEKIKCVTTKQLNCRPSLSFFPVSIEHKTIKGRTPVIVASFTETGD